MEKQDWIAELALILVREHGLTAAEAASYAACLYPEGEELDWMWDGMVPSPRVALEADMEYWEE